MTETRNVNTQDLLKLSKWGNIRKVCIPVLVKVVGQVPWKTVAISPRVSCCCFWCCYCCCFKTVSFSYRNLLLLGSVSVGEEGQGIKDEAWARKKVVELSYQSNILSQSPGKLWNFVLPLPVSTKAKVIDIQLDDSGLGRTQWQRSKTTTLSNFQMTMQE